MPNQMIALQARAPQGNPLGNVLAQSTQMVNMARQMAASERQNTIAAQQLEIARAQEQRAANKEGRDDEAAKIQRISDVGKIYSDSMRWAKFGDEAALQALRDLTVSLVPELDKIIPAARVLATDIDAYNRSFMTAQQLADATVGPRETEVVQDAAGNSYVAVTGGFGPQGVIPLNKLIPDTSKIAPKAPPAGAAPTAAPAMAPSAGVNARATRGSATTPDDLRAQGVDPRSIPLGNPLMKPMSDTGAPAPDLGAIVQTMMDTGVVSQSNLEAMRAAAGPGKDAQLAEILRSNNIRIMPDEQPAAGMRSAVYRPGENDASMTQVQSLQGYRDTGEQFQGKSPMQSPLPGSSQVPLGRVREEAKAQRKTPQEVYEEKRAEKQADTDVEFLDKYGSARDSAMNTLSVIDQMIGDLNVKDGKIVRGKRAPHPGFESVIGAGIPGLRFIPGTQSADFDALVDQIEGGAFLKAYESLRGTGQITEIEGQKATQALTRMRRSSSEVGFIKAAREFEGIIRRGMERAEQRKARLEGGSASRPAPRSETKRGANIDDLLKKYGG